MQDEGEELELGPWTRRVLGWMADGRGQYSSVGCGFARPHARPHGAGPAGPLKTQTPSQPVITNPGKDDSGFT
jgi:hypothetical protein